MANRQPKTHCKRGHEFTPDNEMWRTRDRGYGMETTRTCRECHRLAWHRYRASPTYNKQHNNKMTKLWRDKNKERVVEHRLKQAYGIGLKEYNEMSAKQNERCLICNRIPKNKLVVDHCHDKGHIRGLLCSSCNMRLGWYEQNKQSIKEYLDE